jgi:hypothetical protein
MSNANPADVKGLSELIARLQQEAGARGGRTPPVHLWNPEHCGDIGLEIRRDGSWWQDGVRFTRERLVRLFSTILRRDPDGFYLVTPHEKVVVRVEDAPFIAVRADRLAAPGGETVVLTTNVGDVVSVGAEHPLRVELRAPGEEPAPYVRVRGGLDARIARPVWYELAAWAVPAADGATMELRSAGAAFPLGRAA